MKVVKKVVEKLSKSCRKVDGQRGGEEQASQIACEGREIDKGYTYCVRKKKPLDSGVG